MDDENYKGFEVLKVRRIGKITLWDVYYKDELLERFDSKQDAINYIDKIAA